MTEDATERRKRRNRVYAQQARDRQRDGLTEVRDALVALRQEVRERDELAARDRELIAAIMREVSDALGRSNQLLEEAAERQERLLRSAEKRARSYGVGERVSVWFNDRQRYFDGEITAVAGNDTYLVAWHGDKRFKKNERVVLAPEHETRETSDTDRFHIVQ